MNLVKQKNNTWFPSIFDDFLHPNFFGEVVNRNDWNISVPAVNIKEHDSYFLVEMAVPGMKKEDFNISLDNQVLSISSEKKTSAEEKDKEGRYTRKEFSYNSFKRAFSLPESVATEKIDATYKDGVLLLTLPKKEEVFHQSKRLIDIR